MNSDENERPEGENELRLTTEASGDGLTNDPTKGVTFSPDDAPASPVRAPNRTPAEMVRDAVRVATAKVAAIYHPRAEPDEVQKNAIRRHLEREVDAVLARFPAASPQFELPLAGRGGMEIETVQGAVDGCLKTPRERAE